MKANNERVIGLRERKKAKTMAAIQMHALRLFREIGYHSTTVEQIAEAAEISPSTFFRYFPAKEDVLLTDNYDPLLIASFEEQPANITTLQAFRNAVISAMSNISVDELATVRERNMLIVTVPELRGAALNNLTQTMQMIAEMVAERIGRKSDDLEVRTFVGAVTGVNISMMFYYAENPEIDFARLLDEALSKLEGGFSL
ncbi:TetR family transcriptional regulator [Lysinibacillus agricola]|uniref:TetR family transcriptional regulator n=1 Tax=Lysinibacillus agricola TaxID=2590012 RepID=A0ABX7ALH6_9BACI|nr:MULTISPECIES: TetR family transcriptional regulator [Lysinibacillus]KOS62257.1 TetR family transcriptional regulator [Lysinibacillus sp. FJAT-14222]QQP10514.1 TetR family transcriptional regulator [Lysinibacillus agricola]